MVSVGGSKPASNITKTTIKYRILDDCALNAICTDLQNFDWNILDSLTVDEANEVFTQQLHSALNTHAPEKHKKISPKNVLREPWMTPGLFKVIKDKEQTIQKISWQTET